MEKQNENKSLELIQLVQSIITYYSFKESYEYLSPQNEEEKNTYVSGISIDEIIDEVVFPIPESIDQLIEQGYLKQLEKFIK